ncbi:ATP-grasp domain-containing protein [Oceanobacillus iheyensis]|uniref:ATP-grasp domain-containing protein n=1 Tax=Oceanobacillus iheyensis TaxID=182710 RepID=UPI0036383E11
MVDNRFLESLNHDIPEKANNYMLSTYSIILEAWRRGLDINIRILKEKSGSIEPYYSISNGDKVHHFSATRGDLVSKEAKELTKNKVTTKQILNKYKVPTPEGKEFEEEATTEEIISYATTIDYPLVVKPVSGTGGKGVIAGIQNEEELVEALEYVREKLNSPRIILEKYFEGEDYRIYVIDGQVIAALKRIKANIIGNGNDTIKNLIDKKNKYRSQLPSLTNRPIKVDDETKTLIRRAGYTMDSVLPDGELLYIKTKNNVSAGGDSIDITEQLSESIKQIAIDATNCFGSLPHCGLDLMVDEANDKAVIIEINSRAHITQHLFPMEGQARDIPGSLIDFYFPETKNYNRLDSFKMFIDFDYIYDSCISREAAEIRIPKKPEGPILLTRYLINGVKLTDKFAARVKRLAYNTQVSGYIKPLNNGDISIIIGGNENKIEQFKKSLNKYLPKFSKKYEITAKKRTTPIPHGFHIHDNKAQDSNNAVSASTNEYMKKYSNLQSDYQQLIRKVAEYEKRERLLEITQKQNKQLKKRLKLMENSTSWKITKPIRKLTRKK